MKWGYCTVDLHFLKRRAYSHTRNNNTPIYWHGQNQSENWANTKYLNEHHNLTREMRDDFSYWKNKSF